MPRETDNRQRWITLGTASDLLGVSESTIRRWADAGEIRSYRTSGGHRRILEEDLRGIVASTQAASSARDSNRISDLATARVPRIAEARGMDDPLLLAACLRQAGFSVALADRAWNALDCYIYGFTLHAQKFPVEPEEYAGAAAHFLGTAVAVGRVSGNRMP